MIAKERLDNFADRDTPDVPSVVIVKQEFMHRFYGSEQNALRKRFRFAQGTLLLEIIGIAPTNALQPRKEAEKEKQFFSCQHL